MESEMKVVRAGGNGGSVLGFSTIINELSDFLGQLVQTRIARFMDDEL